MITVEGVRIREDECKKDFKVKFSDLTEEGQKRIFLENKDKFLKNVLFSSYPEIRKLPLACIKELSSESINDVLSVLLSPKYEFLYHDVILELLKAEQLKLSFNLRRKLAISSCWRFRKWVQEDPETPSYLLSEMFFISARNCLYDEEEELKRIMSNKNFNFEEAFECFEKQIEHTQNEYKEPICNKIKAISAGIK